MQTHGCEVIEKMRTSDYDQIVVGSGPAGAVTALCLARSGARVLLLERESTFSFKVGESLPGSTRPLLNDLGLADLLQKPHHQIQGSASAWVSESLMCQPAIRDPWGPGWRLDRVAFDSALHERAVAAGATLMLGNALKQCHREADRWRVELESGKLITALGLIDATGRKSVVARSLGTVREHGDHLVAHVGLFPADDPDTTTLIEAVPQGWWYGALLPHQMRMAIFFSDGGLDACKLARSKEGFTELLQQTNHLKAETPHTLFSCSANTGWLSDICGEGWLAVGDAAMSFDPLSSQGLLTALYSGKCAAEAILSSDPMAYIRAMEAVFRAYQQHHTTYYAAAQRFATHPFWQRRSEPMAQAAPI